MEQRGYATSQVCTAGLCCKQTVAPRQCHLLYIKQLPGEALCSASHPAISLILQDNSGATCVKWGSAVPPLDGLAGARLCISPLPTAPAPLVSPTPRPPFHQAQHSCLLSESLFLPHSPLPKTPELLKSVSPDRSQQARASFGIRVPVRPKGTRCPHSGPTTPGR